MSRPCAITTRTSQNSSTTDSPFASFATFRGHTRCLWITIWPQEKVRALPTSPSSFTSRKVSIRKAPPRYSGSPSKTPSMTAPSSSTASASTNPAFYRMRSAGAALDLVSNVQRVPVRPHPQSRNAKGSAAPRPGQRLTAYRRWRPLGRSSLRRRAHVGLSSEDALLPRHHTSRRRAAPQFRRRNPSHWRRWPISSPSGTPAHRPPIDLPLSPIATWNSSSSADRVQLASAKVLPRLPRRRHDRFAPARDRSRTSLDPRATKAPFQRNTKSSSRRDQAGW